jgi:hypothetical protein
MNNNNSFPALVVRHGGGRYVILNKSIMIVIDLVEKLHATPFVELHFLIPHFGFVPPAGDMRSHLLHTTLLLISLSFCMAKQPGDGAAVKPDEVVPHILINTIDNAKIALFPAPFLGVEYMAQSLSGLSVHALSHTYMTKELTPQSSPRVPLI